VENAVGIAGRAADDNRKRRGWNDMGSLVGTGSQDNAWFPDQKRTIATQRIESIPFFFQSDAKIFVKTKDIIVLHTCSIDDSWSFCMRRTPNQVSFSLNNNTNPPALFTHIREFDMFA